MATLKASVPVEEYLHMSFEGSDCEFAFGQIVERSVGEKPHSRAQKRLIELFSRAGARLHAFPELRLKLAAELFRIPDLSVFADREPDEDVPSTPPLVVIEIVSRDDRYTDILKKLDEYRSWGVPNIWLVDPWLRRLYVYSAGSLSEAPAFALTSQQVQLTSAEIFA